MTTIIESRNLTRRYGRRLAVTDLSLTVPAGSIYGFVGPNGAGKTTTMRIITTLLRPNAGEAWVAGHSILHDQRGVRRAIGYMPDFFGVYDDMKVWEYLDFFGACYGLPPHKRATLTNDLLELVDLTHRRDDLVDSLSRGMKQRLCLARTLVHDPPVLILDEPASGLDPRARVEIRELLRELQRLGKTIFFSTHILSDVTEICTHVGIIEAGRLVAQGTLEEMHRLIAPHRRLRLTLLGAIDTAAQCLENYPGVVAVHFPETNNPTSHLFLEIDFSGDDEAISALLKHLVNSNLPVLRFEETLHNVEEVFMHVTKGIVS